MRPILQERNEKGEYNLVKSMYIVDESSFRNYFRMSRSTFHALLQDIEPFNSQNEHNLETFYFSSGTTFDHSQVEHQYN